jgi:hypothetical protein
LLMRSTDATVKLMSEAGWRIRSSENKDVVRR